jgi:fatty acid desaturase
MLSLFASGRIVDIVLAVTAAEAIALLAYRRRTGRGLPPPDLVGVLVPGVCLMLALRAALVDAWWGWIALWLVAAFVSHVNDLRRRWPPP